MPTLAIFDGFNAIWRLAHSMPDLETAQGKPIELVYGFLRLLRHCLYELEADDALICWESGHSKLRIGLDPEYKAQRRLKESQSSRQQSLRGVVNLQVFTLKKVLRAMAVAQVIDSTEMLEADDYAAAAATLAFYDRRVIVSNDRDYYQLIQPGVEVYAPSFKPSESFLYTHENFKDKVGMTPAQYLECSILAGETTDGIKGIYGIGMKTAFEFLQGLSNASEVFDPLNIKRFREGGGKRIAKIFDGISPEDAKKRLELNRKLMDLTRNRKGCIVAVEEALAGVVPMHSQNVFHIFRRYQFESLLNNFPTWIRPFAVLGKIR